VALDTEHRQTWDEKLNRAFPPIPMPPAGVVEPELDMRAARAAYLAANSLAAASNWLTKHAPEAGGFQEQRIPANAIYFHPNTAAGMKAAVDWLCADLGDEDRLHYWHDTAVLSVTRSFGLVNICVTGLKSEVCSCVPLTEHRYTLPEWWPTGRHG
jgi:hypothetical protein